MTESAGHNGPIFVGGASRSGTTLLRVMLDSHPRICCGPELKLLNGIAEQYQMFTGPWVWPIMESYDNTLSDVQALFHAFIEGLVANYRRNSGKPRWAEKTPQNVYFMASLGEIFPEAQFIHVLRDGRDVACSLLTMDWTDNTGRKMYYLESMAGAAGYWRDTVVSAREQAAHPSLTGRVLEVRYEALVTETAAAMRQVLAFLGEDWDDAVLSHHTKDRRGEVGMLDRGQEQSFAPVNQSALGRWEREMTLADKATFKAEAGELLTTLGYAPADW